MATCLLLPASWKPCALRLLGHRVHRSARIQLSLVDVDHLFLGKHARIGRLNGIKARRLVMRDQASIGHLNWISGRLSILIGQNSGIGHKNHINSAVVPGSARRPQLRIGTWSKITSGHFVNVCETISLGNYTTIAGFGTQLWTHGFVHMETGLERYEIRGNIRMGNNVYVGSHCTFQPGVKISDTVSVGSHASVAKSLLEPGVYVPQELRFYPRSPAQRLARLLPVTHLQTDAAPYFWRDGGGELVDASHVRHPTGAIPGRGAAASADAHGSNFIPEETGVAMNGAANGGR